MENGFRQRTHETRAVYPQYPKREAHCLMAGRISGAEGTSHPAWFRTGVAAIRDRDPGSRASAT